MATVKVKFRASSVADREGRLFYQIIHNRVTRQISTGYKLFPSEWDGLYAGGLLLNSEDKRHAYLATLKSRIAEDKARLSVLVARLDRAGESYTAEDVVKLYLTPSNREDFFTFTRMLIGQLRQVGKTHTAERYVTVMNSFGRFTGKRATLGRSGFRPNGRVRNLSQVERRMSEYLFLLHAGTAGHLQPGR